MPDETNVYSDRDSAPEMDEAPETAEDTPEPKEEGKDKSSDGATGLLSKSLFSGKEIKPGYKCSIVVNKVYDDQVSISLAPHGKSDDEDEEEVVEEIYD